MTETKRKYDLVLLAGGGATVITAEEGPQIRALAKLKGRRLLDYILAAVRDSQRIGLVALVTGSRELPAFEKLQLPEVLLCSCDGSMAEAAYTAIRRLQEQPGHEAITKVVTVCDDLPFLSGEALDDFIGRAEKLEADGAYAIVTKEACGRDFPTLYRTFFHLSEGDFTGGNVSLVSVNLFPDCIEKMRRVYELRKKPLRLANWLGYRFLVRLVLRRLRLQDVEERVSSLFGYRGRAVVTDYASIGTDLDKPGDWAEAEKYL